IQIAELDRLLPFPKAALSQAVPVFEEFGPISFHVSLLWAAVATDGASIGLANVAAFSCGCGSVAPAAVSLQRAVGQWIDSRDEGSTKCASTHVVAGQSEGTHIGARPQVARATTFSGQHVRLSLRSARSSQLAAGLRIRAQP